MRIKNSYIDNVLWLVILIILFFQSLLKEFSVLSNIALLFILIRQIPKLSANGRRMLIWAMIWIGVLIGYSVMSGNQIPNAIRFGLIILFILSAYYWNTDCTFLIKALFYVSVALVLGLICLEIFMWTLSNEEYLALRNGYFLANGMGDVFFSGGYYKLELRGTPLVVFVYMLSYVTNIFPSKYKIFLRLFYLAGLIIAGNFAYQMAIVIFHFAYFLFPSLESPVKMVRRVLFMSIVMLIVGGIVYSYVASEMKAKSAISNATRYDQAEVLWEDMARSPKTLLLGSGLGHTIESKTSFRDYRGNTYFELQTLYIFNQLGLLNFCILVLANIILAFRLIKLPELLLVYGVYVTYAFTNPYIWDTNHIVVITSLLCAKSQLQNRISYAKKKNNLRLSAIQSVA